MLFRTKTYTQALNEFEKTDLEVYQVLIAKEVEIIKMDYNLTDDQYEQICSDIDDLVVSKNYNLDSVLTVIIYGLMHKEISGDESVIDYIDDKIQY